MDSSKKAHIVSALIRELKGADNVKVFSETLRQLNICDLQDDDHLDKVSEDGGGVLFTLVTHHQLGLLPKLIELQQLIKTKGADDENRANRDAKAKQKQ